MAMAIRALKAALPETERVNVGYDTPIKAFAFTRVETVQILHRFYKFIVWFLQ